jgi:hypothetical protein
MGMVPDLAAANVTKRIAMGTMPTDRAPAQTGGTGVHPLSRSLDHVGWSREGSRMWLLRSRCLQPRTITIRMVDRFQAFQVDAEHGVPPLKRPRLGIVRFEKWSKPEREQQQLFEAAVNLRGKEASHGVIAKLHSETSSCDIPRNRRQRSSSIEFNALVERPER